MVTGDLPRQLVDLVGFLERFDRLFSAACGPKAAAMIRPHQRDRGARRRRRRGSIHRLWRRRLVQPRLNWRRGVSSSRFPHRSDPVSWASITRSA